jgi:hypothetical protein
VRLVEKNPELTLDNRFFSSSYSDVDEQNKMQILDQVIVPLKDIIWAASLETASSTNEESRTKLARADGALRLLLSWRA